MRIVIAGGHGQIALRLARVLVERGDEVVGLIRNPEHIADLLAAGANAAIADLERDDAESMATHLVDADAVVFAAGAGPGSEPGRKDAVDRAGAALLADAAALAGVRRYVLVSSVGADDDPPIGTDDVFAAYLRAKKSAEDDLRERDLDWTILRPGALTDAPGTGRVLLAAHVPAGQISRDDVAAALAALLAEPRTIRMTLELLEGDAPIVDAVHAVIADQG